MGPKGGAPPPINHWPKKTETLDIVVVALIGVGAVAMLMGNIVILCNRNYKPIKSKNVPLTFLSSLGGLIWIVAALIVNDHFPRKSGSGLDVCTLWTYWFQACFGFALWLNCLTLHLIALYRVFILKVNTRNYYPLLIPLLFPAVAFCIIASFMGQITFVEAPTPHEKNDAPGDCQFRHKAYLAYVLIALLVMYFLIFLGFAFKLRNAMAQYNEFRLIRRGGILSLFLFLLSLVTLYTRAYDKPVGRCLLSAAVASTIFYYFWARNFIVVYNVLFNQTDYLQKFINDVKRFPSQREREKSSAGFLKMEAQLREVREEAGKLQDKIKELEDEVDVLEREYAAKQQMTSPHLSPNAREIYILKDSCKAGERGTLRIEEL